MPFQAGFVQANAFQVSSVKKQASVSGSMGLSGTVVTRKKTVKSAVVSGAMGMTYDVATTKHVRKLVQVAGAMSLGYTVEARSSRRVEVAAAGALSQSQHVRKVHRSEAEGAGLGFTDVVARRIGRVRHEAYMYSGSIIAGSGPVTKQVAVFGAMQFNGAVHAVKRRPVRDVNQEVFLIGDLRVLRRVLVEVSGDMALQWSVGGVPFVVYRDIAGTVVEDVFESVVAERVMLPMLSEEEMAAMIEAKELTSEVRERV